MIGAIIGDVVGSRFEFDNIKTKEFELFDRECDFTDDTVMTIAIGKALKEYNSNIKVHKVILSNKDHSIPGIYSNSKINHKYDEFIDKIDKVSEEKAYNIVKEIAFNDGIFIGLSSGVNIAACLKYTKQYQNIVVIASDGGERYLSNERLYFNL